MTSIKKNFSLQKSLKFAFLSKPGSTISKSIPDKSYLKIALFRLRM